MFGNQDFSQRPPPPLYNLNYDVLSNLNNLSNCEIQMQNNAYYPQSGNIASAKTDYNSFNNIDDDDESSLIAAIEMRKHDEQTIENFLKENEEEFLKDDKNKSRKESRISDTRTALVSVCKLSNELEKICDKLKENRNIPETEWYREITATESKKIEILQVLDKLEEEQFISKVKTSIEKRKKKRLRDKKQRALRKCEKSAAEERRIKLHAKADAWIKDKQDIIEKEKQEVNMRKDADMVLAEVRGRRNDARKFLALLNELQNLRRIQVNIARARGEHLSSAADEAFSNIIDKLVEQWTAMDRDYSIEEQGLKLMLKTDNEQKIEKQKRNNFDDWENVLFGRKLPPVDSFQRNVHAFVTIRAAWDKYISCNGLCSPIPIGWVMPEPPSSAAWQKYLKKE